MIKLESIRDGDWPAIERMRQALQSLVIDTGGLNVFQRIIAGGLTNGGAVNYGVGFTSSRTAAGTYVVTFTKAMPGSYVIQLGSDNGGAVNQSFWSASSVNGFTFNVRSNAGAAVDAFVNFTATYIA